MKLRNAFRYNKAFVQRIADFLYSVNLPERWVEYLPKNQEYTQDSNNEENKPAKILSSEEINEMINNQIKYSKEPTNNTNEYKIIKQKNNDDMPKAGELINVEEIKNEINQIEFEEEEQKNKKEKQFENGITNNIEEEEEDKNNEDNVENLDDEGDDTNLNIEELRKDVLENNDD